jgi:hypothetical protein
MGLASEGKEELTYNLGVLEGLHRLLNVEDANPIHRLDPDHASTEEIRLLREAGWRKLDIVIRIVEQTIKTRAFLDTYVAPLNKRIRRTDNLDKLRSDLTTAEVTWTAIEALLAGSAETLERDHPA